MLFVGISVSLQELPLNIKRFLQRKLDYFQINARMDAFENGAAAAGLWVPTTLYSFSQNFKSTQQQYVDGMCWTEILLNKAALEA